MNTSQHIAVGPWSDVSQIPHASVPETLRAKWTRYQLRILLLNAEKTLIIYARWRHDDVAAALARGCGAAAEAMSGQSVWQQTDV